MHHHLFALTTERHNLHIHLAPKGHHCGREVEHWREFYDHSVGLLAQGVPQGCHIGRAIFQADHLFALGTSAVGVYVYKVGVVEPLDELLRRAADDLHIVGPQKAQIVAGDFGKGGVALDRDHTPESAREVESVHSQATSEVYGQSSAILFVGGTLLAARLLKGERGQNGPCLVVGGEFATGSLEVFHLSSHLSGVGYALVEGYGVVVALDVLLDCLAHFGQCEYLYFLIFHTGLSLW